MSTQASMSRICSRCRIHIFPSGFCQSISLPSGHLLRPSGCRDRGTARAFGVSGIISSNEPRSESAVEGRAIPNTQVSSDEQQAGPDEGFEGSQRGRPIITFTNTIAKLDAKHLLSGAKSGQRKAADVEKDDPFGPLLSPDAKQADADFIKNYRTLLSDTRRDIEREINDPEELRGMLGNSIEMPEGVKRRAITRKSSMNQHESWPVELPPELRRVASKFIFPPATHRVKDLKEYHAGQEVTMHGFLASPRIMNRKLTFAKFFDFYSSPGVHIQAVSNLFTEHPTPDQESAQEILLSIAPFTPVSISGKIIKRGSTRRQKKELGFEESAAKTFIKQEFISPHPTGSVPENVSTLLEIHIGSLTTLNSVSGDLIYTYDTVFPPEQRHLQLRTNPFLFSTLRLRAKVSSICRDELEKTDFLEVETPLLFKSTPEGAREFLVPTRSKENGGGMCYALPQSPQQYKQILMASGVARYFQLARCFRDEDLRADRQPEFTQLDLEMSFATVNDVISVIERLLSRIWKETLNIELEGEFQRMTWWYAMKFYGTDKPDLRFPKSKIYEISSILPHLVTERDGHVEVFSFACDKSAAPEHVEQLHEAFKKKFKGEGDEYFLSYIVGDRSSLHDADLVQAKISEAKLAEINREIWALPGSIVVIKSRKGYWSGGNTKLGLLRTALINKARVFKLLKTPKKPELVWIIDFPLFSHSSNSEPGQGGTVGLFSTHHPFTAPHPKDIGMLPSAPERVRGEHYDIVVNGVELGGGSRRIHDAALQKYVLEKVLEVDPSRIHQFDHLLDILNSGCPPHAGIALGFDRLIAVLQGTDSVRDVIAFPKSAKGVDLLVGSPSLVSDEDLKAYHLQRRTPTQIYQGRDFVDDRM